MCLQHGAQGAVEWRDSALPCHASVQGEWLIVSGKTALAPDCEMLIQRQVFKHVAAPHMQLSVYAAAQDICHPGVYMTQCP